MTRTYNLITEKDKRRNLRKNMPPAEVLLWHELRGKKILDYKFRRQYSIGKYIVDFYCSKIKLVIEIDGDSHFLDKKAKEYDRKREEFIKSNNINLLRFTNLEIYYDLEKVLEKIKEYLKSCR